MGHPSSSMQLSACSDRSSNPNRVSSLVKLYQMDSQSFATNSLLNCHMLRQDSQYPGVVTMDSELLSKCLLTKQLNYS